jgi:NADH-quinone oxidoreductase subunit M
MLGTLITFPELLVLLPLIAGLLLFFVGKNYSKQIALLASLLVLGVSLWSLLHTDVASYNAVSYIWLKYFGATYYLLLDPVSRIFTFLTALTFPIIIASTFSRKYNHSFYALMLLAQCGLMGVFVSMDALLFYFFWELALIPVYFLCSMWGGERRIQATFKFFIYTFVGSLLMLLGIIFVYLHTPPKTFEDGVQAAHSFSWHAFKNAALSSGQKVGAFFLFLIASAYLKNQLF